MAARLCYSGKDILCSVCHYNNIPTHLVITKNFIL
uniref:Uncharacterized protein n=1 Tax=Anguilla anguilla TaxID=7936 RepID=A0A0E9UNX1_ANGAN